MDYHIQMTTRCPRLLAGFSAEGGTVWVEGQCGWDNFRFKNGLLV